MGTVDNTIEGTVDILYFTAIPKPGHVIFLQSVSKIEDHVNKA